MCTKYLIKNRCRNIRGIFLFINIACFFQPVFSQQHTWKNPCSADNIAESLKTGINTDGIFSRDVSGILKANYSKQDFENIYKAGFRHVRLPIRIPLINEKKPDSISPADITTIKKVIDEVLSSHLKIVFNPVHASKEFKKRLEEEPLLQASFIKFWKALARYFISYNEEDFIIEPFNEPHFKSAEKWNNLQEQLVAEIRKVMPSHIILVTPVTETLAAIIAMKPLKDKNILYSFHYYLPFELTHQGASWTWKFFPAGYRYPNSEWNFERINKDFFIPLGNWAKTNNVKLYGGEFGVIRNADKTSRINWLTDVTKLMHQNKYSGAVWEYKEGAFSILKPLDNTTGKQVFDKELLQALDL